MRWAAAVLASCVVAMPGTVSAQEGGWSTLEVAGGRATLRALGIDDAADRATAMITIIRRLHFSTESQEALEAALRRLPGTGSETLTLPLPMSAQTWQRAIFQRPVAPARLFSAILNDRAARLLFHGLAGLDAPTRAWIEQQPSLLQSFYRDQDAVQAFALFGPALQVHGGRVVVPGGAVAAERWSSVVGASLDAPSQFTTRLFQERDGRIAGLYFLSAFIDPARRRFLLGDVPGGGDRFAALVTSFANCYPRQSNDYPFVLRSKDPAWLLLNVTVSDEGVLAGPRSREFWNAVFDDGEVATPAAGAAGSPVDAAWLVDRLCRASTVDRSKAFDTLLAGQRVFGGISDAELPSAAQALRVRRQFPALFVAMERAGLRHAATIAGVARGARQVERLNDVDSAPVALQQFQGALALVLEAARVRTLTEARARNLVLTLSDVRVRDGRYDGGVAAWLDQQLLPSLRSALAAPASMSAEEVVARALAGVAPASPQSVQWEGLAYLVDYPAAARARFLRVRQRQGGSTLDQALTMSRAAQGAAAARAADVILGATLASWAYTPHVGDTDSRALVGGDPSLRHDLGVRSVNRTIYEQRWEIAVAPRDRGQIAASYLGMEAALAPWSLRRLASDRIPAPPTLGDNDRIALVGAVAFSEPDHLSDEMMHAIAAAVASGAEALRAGRRDPGSLDDLAGRAAISPWRRAVLPWMSVHEPDQVEMQFSPSARARLGGLQQSGLASWGTSGVPAGCQCLRPPMAFIPELIYGRPVGGIVGAYSADLTFRIAELLTELKLPAPLTTAVMTFALRDYIDGVRPAHPADAEAFGRQAWKLTRTTVEDYVGAIAAVGALRPAPVK